MRDRGGVLEDQAQAGSSMRARGLDQRGGGSCRPCRLCLPTHKDAQGHGKVSCHPCARPPCARRGPGAGLMARGGGSLHHGNGGRPPCPDAHGHTSSSQRPVYSPRGARVQPRTVRGPAMWHSPLPQPGPAGGSRGVAGPCQPGRLRRPLQGPARSTARGRGSPGLSQPQAGSGGRTVPPAPQLAVGKGQGGAALLRSGNGLGPWGGRDPRCRGSQALPSSVREAGGRSWGGGLELGQPPLACSRHPLRTCVCVRPSLLGHSVLNQAHTWGRGQPRRLRLRRWWRTP